MPMKLLGSTNGWTVDPINASSFRAHSETMVFASDHKWFIIVVDRIITDYSEL